MAALGHTSAPFCFVIHQFLGFFPGQVHLSEVSFDDIYSVLPWSSWLSLVTSQFPLCWLTSCSRVVPSQDVSQPPEPSFFNYVFQFPWTSFLSDGFISELSLHVIPNSLLWNLWWAASNFFAFVWQIVAMILHHTAGLRLPGYVPKNLHWHDICLLYMRAHNGFRWICIVAI